MCARIFEILDPGPVFAPHTGRKGCSHSLSTVLWSLGSPYMGGGRPEVDVTADLTLDA